MRSLFAVLSCLLLVAVSCKHSQKSIAGTYRPLKNSPSRLLLKEDSSFEMAMLDPHIDSALFPGIGNKNFYANGTWRLMDHRQLQFTASDLPPAPPSINDSISRFTNISSFNFWNRYGEPLPIRYILIPPGRPKPHFGNSLYFFAQDFSPTDTLEFYFDGYAPVRYPGTIPAAIGNNIHKITLTEAYQPALIDGWILTSQRNKLLDREKRVVLEK